MSLQASDPVILESCKACKTFLKIFCRLISMCTEPRDAGLDSLYRLTSVAMKRAQVTSFTAGKVTKCHKSSLVQQNISGLEHRVGVEADAAFVLCVALHLRERKKTKQNTHVTQLKRQLRLFPLPGCEEPFSLL